MTSISDRYIYDFLKVSESINAFTQYIAFSNAFNINYINDILHVKSFNETFLKILLSNSLKIPQPEWHLDHLVQRSGSLIVQYYSLYIPKYNGQSIHLHLDEILMQSNLHEALHQCY